jgi:hypothetical protein
VEIEVDGRRLQGEGPWRIRTARSSQRRSCLGVPGAGEQEAEAWAIQLMDPRI